MRITRREVVAGGAALGVGAACGRTEPFDYGEEVGEDEEMIPSHAALRSTDSNPIFLTSKTTVSSNTATGVNSASLKNPIGGPMEILEIRFRAVAGSTSRVIGGYVGCKLELGKIPLTNGFVPIWLFDRAEALNTENQEDSPVAEFVWRLPRPLYVPDGAVLVPTIQHRGLFKEAIDVRVSYSARTVSPKTPPKKVFLPYAASYVSKAFNAGSITEDFDNSTETDLVNPFETDIELQRFTNRVSLFFTQNPSISTELSSITELLEARMVGMDGRPIISHFTNIRQAFGNITRSWDMPNGSMFPSNSFYSVFLRKLAAAAESDTFIMQAFIGLTGHRSLDFSKNLTQLFEPAGP